MVLRQRLQDMNYALPKTDFDPYGRREISVHPNTAATGTRGAAGNYMQARTNTSNPSISLAFLPKCSLWRI